MNPWSSPLRGFTLVELLIVIVIIGLLAAVIAPNVSSATDDAKAARIMATVDVLRSGVSTHYMHTGRGALEYGGPSWTQVNQHQLSMPQTTSGWKGPYIDHPLSHADNPFGGNVLVYTSFSSGRAGGGFDLLGGGSNTVTGNGQHVEFHSVPEAIAQLVNDTLDADIAGDWKTTGRVEWASSGSALVVFLTDIPD